MKKKDLSSKTKTPPNGWRSVSKFFTRLTIFEMCVVFNPREAVESEDHHHQREEEKVWHIFVNRFT